jgi:hydrogenase expression/formation protein HypD
MMSQVFQIIDRAWRGLGVIPLSGLGLAEDYADFDAEGRFQLSTAIVSEPEECRSGRVLQGLIKPDQCPAFGIRCTPEHPLGATMVSSEGACAAYHRYRPSGQH